MDGARPVKAATRAAAPGRDRGRERGLRRPRSGLRGRAGYVLATGLLAAAAVPILAVLTTAGLRDLGLGIGAAWALQSASYWKLAGSLARGRRVVAVWIGGMGLRLGGVPLVALVGARSGLPLRELVAGYVLALVALLLLEALWLAGSGS